MKAAGRRANSSSSGGKVLGPMVERTAQDAEA